MEQSTQSRSRIFAVRIILPPRSYRLRQVLKFVRALVLVAAQIASVTVIKLSPFKPPKIFLQLVKVALDRDPPTPGLQFEQ